MYKYFLTYVNTRNLANSTVDGFKLAMNYNVVALVNQGLYDPFLNWAAEDNQKVLNRWAELFYWLMQDVGGVEFSQNTTSGTTSSTLEPVEFVPGTGTYEGTCGKEVKWHLNAKTGVLNIYGQGSMDNYSSASKTPWYNYRQYINFVRVSDGVNYLGNYAFAECTVLDKVSLSADVYNIGNYVFSNCTSLRLFVVNGIVNNIGNYSFQNCKSLVYFDFPERMTDVSKGLFSGCTNLVKVELPENLTSIGDYAFNGCSSMTGEVIIPEGVTTIGYATFRDCQKISAVKIHGGVTSIGDYAFYDCKALKDVYYSGTYEQWQATKIGSYNTPLTNATMHWLIYNGVCGDNLTYNFDRNTGVLTVEGTGRMTNYSTDCPAPWDALRSQIKSIVIASGITTIGNDTFFGCESLTEVTLPEGITKIGNTAFRDCVALKKFSIPDSVTSIGHYAFYGCTGFNEFVVGNGVKTIGNHAFRRCTNLRRIVLPASLIAVNKNAFNECSSLAFVVYMGTKDQWDSVTVGDSNEPLLNATMYFYDPEHSCEFGEWVVTVVPTTTNSGMKTHTCSICGAAEIAELPSLSIETAEQVTISFNTGIISGFDSGLSSLDSYITMNSTIYTLSYESNNGKFGTGSKAILKDGDTIVAEYTILIYGDTTGDSWYDGQDAVLVSCLANGMLTKDDVSEAVYMAADCNHDGVIDQLDVDLLNEAGALLANVDQSKPTEELLETSSAYVEYLELIDQSPEIEIEDDTEIDAEPNIPESGDTEEEGTHEEDTENSGSTDFDFIDMIMNFIKSIFEMLIAYIPGLYS